MQPQTYIEALTYRSQLIIENTFLAKYKATFTLKKRNNKEEIEGVHERNVKVKEG